MSEYSYDRIKEFMELTGSKDIKETFAKVKQMAESNDLYGLELYGDVLMAGLWDLDRIKMDLATETILPVPEDPLEDPYFLAARDQDLAIEYYKIANKLEEEGGHAFMDKRVLYKLHYCAKLGIIKDMMADKYEMIAYKNNKYAEAKSIGYFLKYSSKLQKAAKKFDQRPKVTNPRTFQLKHVAKNTLVRTIIGCVLIQGLTFIGLLLDSWEFFKIFMVVLIGYNIPMLIFAYFIWIYGTKQCKPICGCSKLKKAYEMNLETLPTVCKALPDPFDKTPFFIRNLNSIQMGFMWLWSMAGLIVFSLFLTNVNQFMEWFQEFQFTALITSILFTLIPSYMAVSEKKLRGSAKEFKNFIFFILNIFLFAFDDKECVNQLERVREETGAQV